MSPDSGAASAWGPRLVGGQTRTRGSRMAITVVLTVILVLVLAACSASQAASGAMPADATTQRIATVEAERLCSIAEETFPRESDITAALVDRLEAARLTYAEWKTWHDALVTSPELVGQLESELEATCPEAEVAEIAATD